MTAVMVARPARRSHLRAVPSDTDAPRIEALRQRVAANAGGLKAQAKNTLVRAREALGMTHAEFAEWAEDVTGHPVIHGSVKRWEGNGCAPTGEILMLALTVLAEVAE